MSKQNLNINLQIVGNGYVVSIDNSKECESFIFYYIEDAEDLIKQKLSKFCIKERYGYHETAGDSSNDDIPF